MADNLKLNIRINAQDNTRAGFDAVRNSVDNIDARLRTLRNTLLGFLGIQLSGQLFKDLARTADRYTLINATITLATASQKEFNQAQTELTAISQRTGTRLEGNVNLFRRLNATIKDLGDEQTRTLGIVENIAKATTLGGASAETAAAGIGQLNQAFASGLLRGEEFNSVMENTPRVAKAIADGLDVPIGKLREMAEAGKLTAVRVIEAIESQAEVINAEFAKIPLTIGAALTNVDTALVNFIGRLDTGAGASRSVANAFNALANNMQEVADLAVLLVKALAAVYGVKLVQGIGQFTAATYAANQAQRAAAAAAEHESLVQQHALRVQVQVAIVRERAARAMLEEARLQRALAATDAERTAAQLALNRAVAATALRSQQTAAAQTALQAALNGTAVTASRAEKAVMALNGAMQAVFAGYIGFAFGEWLVQQSEQVRLAGSYIAEAAALIETGVQGFFSGISLSERWEQVKAIHAEFEQIRANQTDAAIAEADRVARTEQQKTEAVAKAAKLQAAAFKEVQEATKALTAQIDADAKAQTAAIDQTLANRLAAIDALDAGELAKDQLRLQARINAATQELQLQELVKTQKLTLIDNEYRAELESAKNNLARTRDIETAKRQAKLSVYQGVAEFYAGEVAKLADIYANENALAGNAREQLRTLAQNHEQALIDIERLGMDERHKIRSEENEFDDILLKLRAEQQKGEHANQDTINQLLARAKTLHGDITTAAVQSAETQSEKNSATYDARQRLNKLYGVEKTAIEDNEKAHVKNAKEAGKALEETKKKLTEAQALITDMTTALNKEYALKVGLDADTLNAARRAIADLTKPETKTITIVTQNAGQAAQTGGLIHQFAMGGYTPRAGKLAGYGGGDKVKALLEAGEFIIRKEAVKKLGVPILELINQGELPNSRHWPVKRAMGGLIDADEIKRKLLEKKAQQDAELVATMVNNLALYAAIGKTSTGTGLSMSGALTNMETQLRIWGRMDLMPFVAAIVGRSGDALQGVGGLINQVSGRAGKAGQLSAERDDFQARRELVLDKLKNPLAGLSTAADNAVSRVTSIMTPSAATAANAAKPAQTININLSLNGQTAAGQFSNSAQTQAFLAEVKRAGLVTG